MTDDEIQERLTAAMHAWLLIVSSGHEEWECRSGGAGLVSTVRSLIEEARPECHPLAKEAS